MCVDDRHKISLKMVVNVKLSKLLNFITIFRIARGNAFK